MNTQNRLRAHSASALLVVLSACVAAQQHAVFVAIPGSADSTAVVIVPDAAARVFARIEPASDLPGCRPWAERGTRVWRVAASSVQNLDSIVVRHVQATLEQGGFSGDPPVREFVRQYAGVEIGKRRLIYINGVDPRMLGPIRNRDRGAGGAASSDALERWRARVTQPLTVIDGGPSAWGLLVDPQTRRPGGLAVECGFDHRAVPPLGGPLIPPTA